jgi:hypothetical protein
MKKIIILLALVTSISCSDDVTVNQESANPEIKNKIDLKINGVISNENITSVNASFSCGNQLNIWVESKKNNVTKEIIKIKLTNTRELKYIQLICEDNNNITENFYSPDFIPSSTINISNFQFIEAKTLKFKLNGTLFKKKYSLLEANKTLDINVDFEIKDFTPHTCNAFINTLNLNNNINFTNLSRTVDSNLQFNNVLYTGVSLNGYHININNLNASLLDLPIGTYTFSDNSITEKIEFRKYIGLPKSLSTSNNIIPSEWIKYETQGSFTILSKTIINGFQVVKVQLNFTASQNGQVEHVFNDAEFITAY